MSYPVQPAPSVETMTEQFMTWMAQHAKAKITAKFEYDHAGLRSQTIEIDHRCPAQTADTKEPT